MRRSEMLKLLYLAVDKSITETTSENLVDVILTAAENAGMLPPKYEWGNYFEKHAWEPEETKQDILNKMVRVDMGEHAGRDLKKNLFEDDDDEQA